MAGPAQNGHQTALEELFVIERVQEKIEASRHSNEDAMNFEVAQVLAELEKVANEIDTVTGLYPIKDALVREFTSTEGAEKTKLSLQKDGMNARDLVFVVMLNILGRELACGEYHIYRGVLSGTGQDLLKMWHYAVGQLKASGYYNEKEAADDLEWIKTEIEQVG